MKDYSIEIEGLSIEDALRLLPHVKGLLYANGVVGARVHIWDLPPIEGEDTEDECG